MAVPTAQKLLQESEKRALTTRERRLVVAYLMATEGDRYTNVELAEKFNVSERTIREDKKHIREEKAKFIKDDDVGLIIADICLDFERQVADIEKSKAKAKPGSHQFLAHCKAIMELRLKMVEALQNIGYLPKNLGNMVVQKFEYRAEVHPMTGHTETVPVLEAQVVEPKLLKDENSTPGHSESAGVASADAAAEDNARQVDFAEAASEASGTD